MQRIFLLLLTGVVFATQALGHPLEFIDTSIENASPLWYDFAEDGVVRVHLLYDLERDSPNRAAGHIHFRIHAQPGAKLTLEFLNLDNVWNGKPGSVAHELKTVVVSEDGAHWRTISTEALPTNRIQVHLEMPAPALYLARVEPYRVSDLNRFLDSIRSNPLVEIRPIGKTVQGRTLEIVRVGNPDAPRRVFLRARAHAWEPVGNWVIEGLTARLLAPEGAKFLRHYTVYFLPMANKDGVAMGRTRFNLHGKDLNRNWDRPPDPELAPENFALENWLKEMIAAGRKPDLALELHNDPSGFLQVSRPPIPAAELERHVNRMTRLEKLLRQETWFTEGATKDSFHNPGSLGEGWLQRFGVDAAIHEFNSNWIAGLKDYPSAQHWKEYGAGLATVFLKYFEAADK